MAAPPPKPPLAASVPKPKAAEPPDPSDREEPRPLLRQEEVLRLYPWLHVEHMHPNLVIYGLHNAIHNLSAEFTMDNLSLALPGCVERCVHLMCVTVDQRAHVLGGGAPDAWGMTLLELNLIYHGRAGNPLDVMSVYAIDERGAVQTTNVAGRAESQYEGIIMTEDIIVSIDGEKTNAFDNGFIVNWRDRHRNNREITFGIARLKNLSCSACLNTTRNDWPGQREIIRGFRFVPNNIRYTI